MSRALRAALGKLLKSDQGQLPASTLSPAQCKALDDFARQTGGVVREPSGRGVVYRAAKQSLIERHWRDLSPLSADEQPQDLPDRAANIGSARDSKSARHQHDIHYALLKVGTGPTDWRHENGDHLDLRQVTHFGAAALAIIPENRWVTQGELWLVENQALFDRLDWLPSQDNASVFYYSGQLSGKLLDWLAERPRADQLWFFPDYDGVGLANYARARERLGDRIDLWLMPNWETKLATYGHRDRWQRTRLQFDAAWRRLTRLNEADPALTLMKRMAELGLGLEQEAVWLPVEK